MTRIRLLNGDYGDMLKFVKFVIFRAPAECSITKGQCESKKSMSAVYIRSEFLGGRPALTEIGFAYSTLLYPLSCAPESR
jgi:hypothetical protein